jgi:hypothetical protein
MWPLQAAETNTTHTHIDITISAEHSSLTSIIISSHPQKKIKIKFSTLFAHLIHTKKRTAGIIMHCSSACSHARSPFFFFFECDLAFGIAHYIYMTTLLLDNCSTHQHRVYDMSICPTGYNIGPDTAEEATFLIFMHASST